MYRIYNIDSIGNEYCITGLIPNLRAAQYTLRIVQQDNPNAYIKLADE